VLYVGKATNLRERVSSYLSNAAGHSDKTLDLIRHARDVRVAVLDSALEAALEEAAAIRREKPPYNRLGKHLPQIAFLKLALRDRYPRLSIVTRVSAGTARYAGPFKHRAEAERVLGLLTRLFRLRTCAGPLHPDAAAAPCFQGQIDACTAPCAARCSAEAYRRQVEACLAVLDGDAAAGEAELVRRRDAHAASLRFEAADHVQRDLRLLERVVRRQRTFGWIAAGGHFLLLQPTGDRRAVRAYAVNDCTIRTRSPASASVSARRCAARPHGGRRMRSWTVPPFSRRGCGTTEKRRAASFAPAPSQTGPPPNSASGGRPAQPSSPRRGCRRRRGENTRAQPPPARCRRARAERDNRRLGEVAGQSWPP